MNWLKRFLQIEDPPAQPAKEKQMAVKMTGIWQRKDVDFVDIQAMNRAYSLVCNHPYTIANTAELAAEYAAIYGSDELQILKSSCAGAKYNMVQSPTQAWVIGGMKVPSAPKIEPVLKDGYEWVNTPFGSYQKPIGAKPASIDSKITDLDDAVMQRIEATVYKAVTAALEAFASH